MRLSWRFALQLLLIVAATIYSINFVARWLTVDVERRWLAEYQVSLYPFADGVLARHLLERTPRADWDAALARVAADTRGATEFRTLPLTVLANEAGLDAASIDAITAGKSLLSRVVAGRAQETLVSYQRLGNTNDALVITTDNSKYYSAEERAMAERATRIRSLSRWAIIVVIVVACLLPFMFESRRLLVATSELGRGNLGYRVRLPAWASLRPIGDALNQLAGRVESLLRSHRELVNAAAHELRTPLTRLRYAQRLAIESQDATERAEYLGQIERDLGALDGLVDELLFYARLERAEAKLDLVTSFDTKSWLNTHIGDARVLAASTGRDLTIGYTTDSGTLVADARSMGRALNNLLSNAIVHARAEIHVEITRDAIRQTITVRDDGPGIPARDRERVFQPFVRLDDDRANDRGGHPRSGLGLAIVARIAALHGGSARVDEARPSRDVQGGTVVTITWPTRPIPGTTSLVSPHTKDIR